MHPPPCGVGGLCPHSMMVSLAIMPWFTTHGAASPANQSLPDSDFMLVASRRRSRKTSLNLGLELAAVVIVLQVCRENDLPTKGDESWARMIFSTECLFGRFLTCNETQQAFSGWPQHLRYVSQLPAFEDFQPWPESLGASPRGGGGRTSEFRTRQSGAAGGWLCPRRLSNVPWHRLKGDRCAPHSVDYWDLWTHVKKGSARFGELLRCTSWRKAMLHFSSFHIPSAWYALSKSPLGHLRTDTSSMSCFSDFSPSFCCPRWSPEVEEGIQCLDRRREQQPWIKT